MYSVNYQFLYFPLHRHCKSRLETTDSAISGYMRTSFRSIDLNSTSRILLDVLFVLTYKFIK